MEMPEAWRSLARLRQNHPLINAIRYFFPAVAHHNKRLMLLQPHHARPFTRPHKLALIISIAKPVTLKTMNEPLTLQRFRRYCASLRPHEQEIESIYVGIRHPYR